MIRRKADSATKTEPDAAFASPNSKRLDFAIIDRFGTLRLAIEYQVSVHYGETSFMRHAIKRSEKPGMSMFEIVPDFQRDDVISDVPSLLGRPNTSELAHPCQG